MEQRTGKERIGIDLDGCAIFRLRQTEPFIQSLFRQRVLATKLLHRGEMKEELVHFFHPHQAESEFARALKIERCFRRGETFYCENRGRHHGAQCELGGMAFRRFGLPLHEFEAALQ